MSILASIHTLWSNTSALNTAIAATKVYTDLVPETLTFPFAVLSLVSAIPTYDTGGIAFETASFQVAIYHTSGATCQTLADTVAGVLDGNTIASGGMKAYRTGYAFNPEPEILNGNRVFRALLEYEWGLNH